MKKKVILSVIMAIFALGASVNAQSVTFTSIQANNQEGVDYTIRIVNPTPGDTAHTTVVWSNTSNFSIKKVLKKYAFTDSIKIITENLDGLMLGMPVPPATIYIIGTTTHDSAKWSPVNTGAKIIALYPKPEKPSGSYANKPIAGLFGVRVAISLNCNSPWRLYKYYDPRDSLTTVSGGSVGYDSFPAMNGTIYDTLENVMSGGWAAYKIVSLGGDTMLGTIKLPRFTPNASPWSKITLAKWDGSKWVISCEATGNNLATTATVIYLEPGASNWKSTSNVDLIGQGIENFNANVTTSLQGTFAFRSVTKNSMGVDTSSVIYETNESPTTAFVVTNGTATYLSPGKIKFTGNLTLSAGNTATLNAMISKDTSFSISQTSPSVTYTASGPIEVIFDGILDKGQMYVTWRGSDSKTATWVEKVRPFTKTYVNYSASTDHFTTVFAGLYPNPTTTSEGFTVNCTSNKPETLTMLNSVGQVVYEAIVSNNNVVKPNVPAGLYTYRLGAVTGRVLFH
jgi:hypothetical protein